MTNESLHAALTGKKSTPEPINPQEIPPILKLFQQPVPQRTQEEQAEFDAAMAEFQKASDDFQKSAEKNGQMLLGTAKFLIGVMVFFVVSLVVFLSGALSRHF